MNSFYVLEDQRLILGRLFQNLWVKSDVGWKREREEGEREICLDLCVDFEKLDSLLILT